jgi:purine-binding chemotaxis protein CheW
MTALQTVTHGRGAHPGTAASSVFTVFIDGEIFGLPVHLTQTVFKVTALTRIPLGPKGMAGLVNFRGKVIVAISLRTRLGLEASRTKASSAITLEHKGESVALLVDRIGDALTLAAEDRLPLPQHIDPRRALFVTDLYRCGSTLIPILDVPRLCDFTA